MTSIFVLFAVSNAYKTPETHHGAILCTVLTHILLSPLRMSTMFRNRCDDVHLLMSVVHFGDCRYTSQNGMAEPLEHTVINQAVAGVFRHLPPVGGGGLTLQAARWGAFPPFGFSATTLKRVAIATRNFV